MTLGSVAELFPQDASRTIVNMGPSHPAMHGACRVLLELEGERVMRSEVEVGYLHRGFEKMCENVTYTQVVPYTDRLNYVSPLINNVGYALAVEKLFGVEVTPRCAYARVLMSEISRITDHLTCIAAMGVDLGAFSVFFYLIKARETLWHIIERVTGARLTVTWTRPGGLSMDLPAGLAEECRAAFQVLDEAIRDTEALLTKNRIWVDRLRGVGAISAQDAIALGFTGPCLRATGVRYDVRKAAPYLVYGDLDFEIPVGTDGDAYDRYLVRLQEIRQSRRIAEQCLERMPGGPVNLHDPRVILPPKEEVYGSIEGLMNHFKIIIEGVRPPAGEVYQAVEGGNGELGFYLVSDGSGRPYKCRVRPPCFAILQGLPRMIEGGLVADVTATFGSLNVIFGELDR